MPWSPSSIIWQQPTGVISSAGKVTAAYHLVYDYVTCGLTAKKPGAAPCPTLVIEHGITLLFSTHGPALPLHYPLSVTCKCKHKQTNTHGQKVHQHGTQTSEAIMYHSENSAVNVLNLKATLHRASECHVPRCTCCRYIMWQKSIL